MRRARRRIIYGSFCLGAAAILGGCSSPESSLAHELRLKSESQGLALARIRGEFVDIIPFNAEPLKGECSFRADAAYFSSDGSKVLVIDEMGVTIRRIDGSIVASSKLRFPNMHGLSLSPDGRQFLLATTHGGLSELTTSVYRAEPGSDKAELLVEPSTAQSSFALRLPTSAGWSADGHSVVYSRGGEIFKLNHDTRERTLVAHGTGPSCSPDGKWIAYNGLDGLAYLMTSAGANPKAILGGHQLDGFLHWSPDSEYLLFAEKYNPGPIEFLWRPIGSSARLCIFRVRDAAILPVFWFGPKGVSSLSFGWIYNYRQFCK